MNKENIIPLGKLAGPYGIKGEFLIKAYNTEHEVLINSKIWYILPKDNIKNIIELNIITSKQYKQGLLASCEQFNMPEQIKKYIGSDVGVPRELFPQIQVKNEFYWVDLIDKEVFTIKQERLGIVGRMMDNGIQSILCIHPTPNCSLAQEILIPFTDLYVKEVKDSIIVEWEIEPEEDNE